MEQQLTKLSNVISCLRTELNKDLPIQHVAILLAVVEQPGASMRDLMIQLKMPQGSFSRNVKLLSDQYELLYTTKIPAKRKQSAVYPTDKCINIVDKLCQLMQPDNDMNLCCCDTKVA